MTTAKDIPEYVKINMALAFAIGWTKTQVYGHMVSVPWDKRREDNTDVELFREFDYRSPMVIWPIAVGCGITPSPFLDHNLPPGQDIVGWEVSGVIIKTGKRQCLGPYNTPEEAVARAAIAGMRAG